MTEDGYPSPSRSCGVARPGHDTPFLPSLLAIRYSLEPAQPSARSHALLPPGMRTRCWRAAHNEEPARSGEAPERNLLARPVLDHADAPRAQGRDRILAEPGGQCGRGERADRAALRAGVWPHGQEEHFEIELASLARSPVKLATSPCIPPVTAPMRRVISAALALEPQLGKALALELTAEEAQIRVPASRMRPSCQGCASSMKTSERKLRRWAGSISPRVGAALSPRNRSQWAKSPFVVSLNLFSSLFLPGGPVPVSTRRVPVAMFSTDVAKRDAILR